MKIVNESILTSVIIVSLTSLLYSYMVLHRKVKTQESEINLIKSTHISYMVIKDNYIKDIDSIKNTLEAIALTLPFKGTGWQTPFIEKKIAREMAKLDGPPYYGEFEEDKL